MLTQHKSFVVLDLPEPARSAIQSIRDQLKTFTAKLPVEITLAGSSGVGPIPERSDLNLIADEIQKIASGTSAFEMEFGAAAHFPETGIFYLPPVDRGPFDSLHAALAESKIPFPKSPFPYNPHCSLRVGPKVDPAMAEMICSLPFPRHKLLLDTIAVYSLDGATFSVSLLRRFSLKHDHGQR
jgi:2'-5' RNA ligase